MNQDCFKRIVFANKVVAITGHSQITDKVLTCSFLIQLRFQLNQEFKEKNQALKII